VHRLFTFLLIALACGRSAAPPNGQQGARVVARFDGGVVTTRDLDEAAARLPTALKNEFRSPAGQRELAQSVVDKRLLVQEARRSGLDARDDIRKEVAALEDRLLVQALLDAEEKRAGKPSEAELREYFARSSASFAIPERVRFRRGLARFSPTAPAPERARGRARCERWVAQLRAGQPADRVLRDGDGPERTQGALLGPYARSEMSDRALADAAFALTRPGEVSPVVSTPEGCAALQLVEKQPSRVPSFEEARPAVESRYTAVWKRKVFDRLVERLRTSAGVSLDLVAQP
jgi:parvulin-like peptidyl-prolyl isomerase